jgi:hypothetical protein
MSHCVEDHGAQAVATRATKAEDKVRSDHFQSAVIQSSKPFTIQQQLQ